MFEDCYSNMCRIFVVFLLHLTSVYSAPLNLQVLHSPQHKTAQPAQQILQQQLLELQQLQDLQNNIDLSAQLRIPPVIILLPRQAVNDNELAKTSANTKSGNKGIINEDLDSITIDAEQEETAIEPQRVLLLPSYARLSIGDIISAIPFLPIEINVPDTIGWAYNGISSGIASIISIFGRRPSSQTNPSEISLKSALQLLEMKKQNNFVPIILMPVTPQILPIQLPIQV